ncbi:sensor histidine kinase [Sphingomonas corticis]|jgi:PAS domain S-box-containing protein|uniref:histidine kinase n=1 Tax=Sphingomonas corticis TaxID=2722791 RepID=A0ABX1CUM7_9SPHN|nr:PAS domain-containing protein [Sphingomonas corticis]NJR80005.1 PAS domain-containing protein [Sphingomonas corticis]
MPDATAAERLTIDYDWSSTPLGSIDSWSDDLRQAVERAILPRPVEDSPPPTAMLDALFSAAPIGLAIWDRDLRFVRVNDSLAEMNGLSPAQHIGRSPADLFPDLAGLDALLDQWRAMLETGEPLRDVEVVGSTQGLGGGRSWNEHFFPIRVDRAIIGIGAVVEETTERKRVEAELVRSEARFREFAEASSDILWLRNTDTAEFEFLSGSLRSLLSADVPGRGDRAIEFDWQAAIVPEDRAAAFAELAKVRDGHRVTHSFRVRLPGRTRVRWIKNTAFPLPDRDGIVRRIGGIAQDVTEEIETDQRLRLMIGELQHRTRNLMGVVQAVAESTLETSPDLGTFAAAFENRMRALSRAQNLLSTLTGSERLCFDDLLRAELDAFGALPEDDHRVTLNGPAGILLRSSSIQTLALALHELTTNAIKHGALAQPAARLSISWARESGEGGADRLVVHWRETDVAMTGSGRRDHRGQGRELIEFGLPHQLGARLDYRLTDDGVACLMSLPVTYTPA